MDDGEIVGIEIVEESRPGDGYEPDPPARYVCRYVCPGCGARYETFIAADRLERCRNRGCQDRPERHRGAWGAR